MLRICTKTRDLIVTKSHFSFHRNDALPGTGGGVQKTLGFGLLGVLICLLTPNSAHGATHTNVIFKVSIGMVSYIQAIVPLSTNAFAYRIKQGKLATADVVRGIADAPSFATNHLRGAKLLYRVTGLGDTNQDAGFILRSGTNDFDVRGFLSLGFPQSYATVTSKAPGLNNSTNATDYGIASINLSGTSGGYFTAQGFSITKNTSIFRGHDLIQLEEFPASITATMGGTGASGGYTTLYQGTVVLSGRTVEIKEGP
jgi:hypothetical protein